MDQLPIRSLNKEALALALASLSSRYENLRWPFDPHSVFRDCITELGGLFACQTSRSKQPKRIFFFRARNALSFSTEEETKDPNQFSYPPASTTVGRAHIPGQSVFYGSDSYEGAIREVKTPDEIHYYISVWHTNEIIFEPLNFLFARNITAQRLLDNYDRAVHDLWKQHDIRDELNRKRATELLRTWSDLFLGNSYTITSSIANQSMFGGYANHAVIAFGSSFDGSFVNYAIRPDFANQLTLRRVYSVQLNPDGAIGFIQCASIGADGRLGWRQILQEDLPENDPFIPTNRKIK